MGRMIAIVVAIFVGLVLLGKCVGNDESPPEPRSTSLDNEAATESFGSSRQSPTDEGEPISVPSDPGASYRLLKWSRLPNGNLESMSRRDGPSGTSFARREIDCDSMIFRYLGEGDTFDEALADSPNPGEMAPLTSQSISTHVSQFTCDKARTSK